MERFNQSKVHDGTVQEFVRAADLGARLEARSCRASGLDPDAIRRAVVAGYRDVLDDDLYAEALRGPIMEAVRRAVDEELVSPFARLGVMAS